MTGPMLGEVARFSAALPVALSGLARYRSDHFGPASRTPSSPPSSTSTACSSTS